MKKLEKYMMLIAVFFFSGAFIAGNYSTVQFPPFSLTLFRFLFAFIFMLPIMKLSGENMKLHKGDIWYITMLAIVGMVGYHVFFFSALRHTSVINSSLIAAINPIATTIFSVIILNEKLTTKNIIAIGVCFLGIIVVITKGNLGILKTLSFNVGDLYMLVAVIVWALYTVLSKKMLKKYSPIKVTTYVFAMTIVVLIPALIWENPATYIGNTDMKGWLSILYMALFASTCGYLIQQISIKKIGPMRTNLYYNLVPVFSMILSLLILKTTVSPVQIVAGIFIIVGVLINTSFTSTK